MTKLLIAYSSIIFGFYFAFSLVFPDEPSMNHMLYRFVQCSRTARNAAAESFVLFPDVSIKLLILLIVGPVDF